MSPRGEEGERTRLYMYNVTYAIFTFLMYSYVTCCPQLCYHSLFRESEDYMGSRTSVFDYFHHSLLEVWPKWYPLRHAQCVFLLIRGEQLQQ